MIKNLAWLLTFTILLGACSTKSKDALFEKVDDSGISFTNKVVDDKDANIFKYSKRQNGFIPFIIFV